MESEKREWERNPARHSSNFFASSDAISDPKPYGPENQYGD
jgi:hypothetical protein